MNINPITLASAAYALISRSKGDNELSDQKAIIAEMEPYYAACEKNELYDAPAAALEQALQSIKDNLRITYEIQIGHPGVTTYFSFRGEVTIHNDSEYDMDVVGLLMIPQVFGFQWGDVSGYTLLDYVDVSRLSGRVIPAGGSQTITISFRYMKLSNSDRKLLKDYLIDIFDARTATLKLLDSKFKGVEKPVLSQFELVVKKDRTSFADAQFISYGASESKGVIRWMGYDFYPDSMDDGKNTIQSSMKPDEYGYLSFLRFFDNNPILTLNNNTAPNTGPGVPAHE